MLVNARLPKAADNTVVLFDFHKGFQIDVGNARGLLLDGQQQRNIPLPEAGTADLPQALAHRRLAVHFAEVVAERALQIALVGLADGRQTRAKQAGAAAPGKFLFIAHIQGAALQIFQMGNLPHQPLVPCVHRVLDLAEHRIDDLLLVLLNLFILRQSGKKSKPAQRVLFGNFHASILPESRCISRFSV